MCIRDRVGGGVLAHINNKGLQGALQAGLNSGTSSLKSNSGENQNGGSSGPLSLSGFDQLRGFGVNQVDSTYQGAKAPQDWPMMSTSMMSPNILSTSMMSPYNYNYNASRNRMDNQWQYAGQY